MKAKYKSQNLGIHTQSHAQRDVRYREFKNPVVKIEE